MKTILKITKNELSSLFYSPIAWLILIIFAFQAGMVFGEAISETLRRQALGYNSAGISRNLLTGWGGAFASVQEYLYLYIPLLTMGLMSQEFNRGSIKLLYSSPITNTQIIFGKYLSMLVYALILIGILFICFLFCVFTVKNLDIPYAMTGLLGVFLLICAYAAIGLFMSTLTSYQVVAAVGTLAVLTVLNFIGGLGQEIPFVRDITYWLSISGRSDTLLKGLICSEDILYFLLVIILFITLSILKLQSERTKRSRLQNAGRYGIVIIVTLLIGYGSSRPMLMCYYDATEMKSNTLTQNSQDVMKKLDGPLTITTYVNILDEKYYVGMPQYYNQDFERFEQYVRFKPEIKMKYVYYYDKANNPDLDRRYPTLSDKERMEKICDASEYDPKDFLSPDEIKKIVDLSGEQNRFVRIIERGNGQKSTLRIYDDNMTHPSESEITASLKRMVVKPPMVAFLTGHGERSIYGGGERDYAAFAQNQTFRYSLLNQGFDVTTLSLTENPQILADIDVLVITDLKKPLTPEEKTAVDNYIARGGNLIIAGETRRQNNMNPLIADLGLKFMPGILVQQSKDFTPDIIFGNVTPGASRLTTEFWFVRATNQKITMPGAVGIETIADKGFTITPLIATDSTRSWNELETTDFIEDTVKLNPTIGEIEKSIPTAVYLTREINGKEQRIIVMGDADCIDNDELTRSRSGFRSANFTMITESFRLLSSGEFPIDTERKRSSDNKLFLSEGAGIWVKIFFMGVIPALLTLLSLMLWWKRRGR